MPRITGHTMGYLVFFLLNALPLAQAQIGPTSEEVSAYGDLHKAAHIGDLDTLVLLIDAGTDLEARDSTGRTPLHVAAFASHELIIQALAKAGADMNALESRAYDVVTIAAVANDIELLDLVLDLGASAGNVTSPYDGTALIAAAHLGHYQVVDRLVESNAPLDHVNNLDWTALIEAVVLGDGGPNHVATVNSLINAGADQTIGDGQGVTPLEHARLHGYNEMIELFAKQAE